MSSETQNLREVRIDFLISPGILLSTKVLGCYLDCTNSSDAQCSLVLALSLEEYKKVASMGSFNLKPALRNSQVDQGFQSSISVEIEIGLQANVLSELLKYAADQESIISHLVSLSQSIDSTNKLQLLQPNLDQLLCADSWFALSVKQVQETGEVGYRTFWSYVNPAALTPEAVSSSQFSDAVEQFIKDRDEADLQMVENAISDVFAKITNSFKDLNSVDFLKQTENEISKASEEFSQALNGWTNVLPNTSLTRTHSNGKIYEVMIKFFSEDDWAFAKLQGEPTLRLAFNGKNGQWDCYVKAREAEQQFVFYSICPISSPIDKRLVTAEFITRANYGLTIGNFELDFNDGEIRYKTSIDVEGDRLTPALIKRLVYINVLTMDEYLPGIKAVIETEISPEAALQATEQSAPVSEPDH
jgi:hypothetical protein